MADLQAEISELEARIEELHGVAAQCRKIIILAKITIAAGALLLGVTALGQFGREPSFFLLALIAVIGGIVLLGSNTSTLAAVRAIITSAEAHRMELIDELHLPRA